MKICGITETDRYYARVVNDVLNFVLSEKSKNYAMSLVDIITSYCFKNDLEPELVGDAISQDFYFKRLIEQDLKAKTIQDW